MARDGIDLPDAHDKIKDVLRGKYASGDVEKAIEQVAHIPSADCVVWVQSLTNGTCSLLLLHDESTCGIVKEINRGIPLLGAENNGKVTCYLDSLLFALFARLDSFEVG